MSNNLMLAARIGLSLKSKIAANVAIVLAIITIFLWVFIPLELNDLAVTWAERRGTGIALVLARSLEPSLDFDDATSARELLKGLEAAPGALYGVLYRGDLVALAAWRGELAPKLKDKIATEVVVLATAERLDILAPVSVKGGSPGMLALGFSLEEMQRETRRNSFIVGLVLLLFFAVGLVVSFAIGTLTVRPVRALTALSTHIVETGDLTQSVEVTTQDEVGQLARAFHQMVTSQRTVMLSVKDLAAGLSQVIEHSSRVAEGVVTGSETVRSRTQDTSSAMQRSLASLRDIAENADAMQAAAAESTLAITEMGGVMRLVKDSITAMVSATEETAAAIEQMNRGVTETSRNLSDVSSLLGDTSAALSELDASFREVQDNAENTARFSGDVQQDAERGVATVQETVRGINEIRELSRTGASVIEELGRDIGEIGKILSVINELSEQTNLLSLNAAIVAAQAGDRGRGFSVVAEEIKQLAASTTASTKEIAALIARIRQQSTRAATAMNASIKSVDNGVELTRKTDAALQQILSSSGRSTAMASAIATAAVEQARTLQAIAAGVHRIAQTVETLSNRSIEQAQGSTQIVNSTSRIRELVDQLQHGGDEQTRSTTRLDEAMKTTHMLVTSVHTAQRDQTRETEQVLQAVDAIRDVAETQTRSVEELEQVIETLRNNVGSLQSTMSRFRV